MATLSIFLVNGFSALSLDTSPERVIETTQRQERLQNFLAAYAHRNYRIPCPADPAGAGTPTVADDGFERPYIASTGCNGGVVGIIPWKTLGIPQNYAKDAWGHYFTYVVSPAFTMVNRDIYTAGADNLPKTVYTGNEQVHARCRLQNVWVFDVDPGAGVNNRNINPFKARFCCAPYMGLGVAPFTGSGTGDITIQGYAVGTSIDATLTQSLTPVLRTTTAALYAGFDTPVTTYSTNDIPYGIIYAIVSHGRNGNGAYGGPLTGGVTKVAWTIPSAAEAENSDDDSTLQWSPFVNSGDVANTYFDDMLVFGTQDTLWARLGGYDQSCARPYTDYAPMEWELGG